MPLNEGADSDVRRVLRLLAGRAVAPPPPPGPVTADEFATLMARLGPFGSAPRIVAGVSGGPHSLALALLARDWAAARGGSLLALVVDHGLRPGSAAEATAVVGVLRGAGVPARLLPLGLPAGTRLHERARGARLAALLRAAAEAGAPCLLLGHHRGDQAETVAFRALRGSGSDGLAGMAAARPAAAAMLLRPLLDLPAARLEATVAASGLVPVRDPSNDNPRFDRARWRAEMADPGGTGPATAALARTAAAFARVREARAGTTAGRLAAAATFRPEGWAGLDRAALGADAVAVAALSALVRAIGGAAHPPRREAVAALLARGGGTLAGALWRGAVLCREPAACAAPIPAIPGALWDGRWRVLSAPAGSTVGALGAEAPTGQGRGGWPAAVLAALPAIRRPGAPIEVPALGTGTARLALEPAGGPIP